MLDIFTQRLSSTKLSRACVIGTRSFLVIFCLTSFAMILADDTDTHYRSERQINSIPLVYPYGGTYKLLIGFASPVANKDNIGLLFGVNFQYQYLQFTNISQLSQYYFVKDVSRELHKEEQSKDAEERRDERLVFYKSMEDIMTTKGMNGPECMLRAICEASQFPVEEEGFVGEILHMLLTPDYGRTLFDDEATRSEEMSTYVDAAVAGRQIFSCPAVYGGCPEGDGLMELISTLRDD